MRFYRPYLPMFGGIFFCLLSVGASLAVMPFYVLDSLHGNKIEAGAAVAAIAVSAVICRPIAGRLADRHGYRRIMLSGAAICAAAGLAYYAGTNLPVLIAVRILHGVGDAGVYTGGAAWLVSLCPPERRGRVVGLYGIFMWLGITLGALIGTVAQDLSGYHAVWGLCIVVSALGFGSVLTKGKPAKPDGVSATRTALLPVGTIVPGIALSLAALGYAALAAFVALHMKARGVSNGIAAFNAFGFTYVGVRLFIGNLPDRLGARPVAFWSALVEAAGLLVVALAHNLVAAVAGGLIMGAGLSLLFPALAILVIEGTEAAQRGAALGAFTSFWDVGVAIGGPLAGVVASVASYPAIYFVMLGCAVASAGLSLAIDTAPQVTTSPTR